MDGTSRKEVRMITLNIVERVSKNKIVTLKRSTKIFNSTDKARKYIKPVVSEMKLARVEKRDPKIAIEGVSYDTNSEEKLLAELGAVQLSKYESEF